MERFDLLVIGGGVIGCAVARAMLLRHPHYRVAVLNKDAELALHQSGRNSGVVHVGYNQKPGTIKARFVVEGSARLRKYCREHGLPLVENGIAVVARTEPEEAVIAELQARGAANGAVVELIGKQKLHDLEPYVAGRAALFAPEGASFDARSFVLSLAAEFIAAGGQVCNTEAVTGLEETSSHVIVTTNRRTIKASMLVNAAGLFADRIARMLGAGKGYAVVPFRGEYYELAQERRFLVRSHVYAAPDLHFPFLGVHFSKTVTGQVTIGPGAVLALGREAYGRADMNPVDILQMSQFPGFWRMFASGDFRRAATLEWRKSLFKSAVHAEAQELIPEVQCRDLLPYRSGIRAQVVDTAGKLIDDLVVDQTPRSLHVLNAVSPALTCSLPFADHIVGLMDSSSTHLN